MDRLGGSSNNTLGRVLGGSGGRNLTQAEWNRERRGDDPPSIPERFNEADMGASAFSFVSGANQSNRIGDRRRASGAGAPAGMAWTPFFC